MIRGLQNKNNIKALLRCIKEGDEKGEGNLMHPRSESYEEISNGKRKKEEMCFYSYDIK